MCGTELLGNNFFFVCKSSWAYSFGRIVWKCEFSQVLCLCSGNGHLYKQCCYIQFHQIKYLNAPITKCIFSVLLALFCTGSHNNVNAINQQPIRNTYAESTGTCCVLVFFFLQKVIFPFNIVWMERQTQYVHCSQTK